MKWFNNLKNFSVGSRIISFLLFQDSLMYVYLCLYFRGPNLFLYVVIYLLVLYLFVALCFPLSELILYPSLCLGRAGEAREWTGAPTCIETNCGQASACKKFQCSANTQGWQGRVAKPDSGSNSHPAGW